MTNVIQTWDRRVTIGGTETDVLSASSDFGVGRIGTCSLDIPIPIPGNVAIGAAVTVEASLDGAWLSEPLFTGKVRQIDNQFSASGAVARVLCKGPLDQMAYPIGHLIFAGGARSLAQNLITSTKHLGTETVTWYEVDVPVGTTYNVDVTPLVDSSFVWLAGIHHGSNSYDASVGDKKTKKWSRVEVYQAGDKIGYAHLPVANEDWSSMLDYTNHANWDDFELFIAAPIVAADGDVTFRFVSGYKPGTSDRDEYEVDNVTWQTAGKQSIRQIIRGLLKRSGLTSSQYDVYEVTSLGGTTIRLGGNGLVDNGQIVLDRRDVPLSFVQNILDLFGFVIFDGPDGVVRVGPFRGNPSGTAVQTFTEGVNILGVPTATIDPNNVYNKVKVEGASGTTEAGTRFAYEYLTADVDVVPSEYIPDPPGENLLTLSSSLLVSNTLCAWAGDIAEANNREALTVAWDSWPHVLRPAQIVQVNAATAGFTGKVFVESLRYDLDASGYRMAVTGWDGVATEFVETPDPDPLEADDEPTDPRPDDEWLPYTPLAGVA